MTTFNIYKTLLLVLILPLISCNAQSVTDDNNKTNQSTAGSISMHSSKTHVKAGMVYSEQLANLFGVPKEQSLTLTSPLLGAALDIKQGNHFGNVCRLHVYFDTALPVRLPSAQQLASASAQLDQFPFASIKKPAPEIRQEIGQDVRHLANRAIVRFGSSALTSEVVVSQDPDAAYVSMPLDGYHKDFVPGVSWLVMTIHCSLAAREEFKHISMFLETPSATPDLILNQVIRPSEMVEFKIPNALFTNMKVELEQALLEDETAASRGRPASWFKVIN
jgi:hypothetical protein